MKGRSLVCALMFSIMLIFSSAAMSQDKTIEIATEPTWEPYFGEKMKNGGLMVDIATEAFRKVGYKMNMNWMPWKRAMNQSFEGKYDGLPGCYFTEERAEKLKYSDPITTAEVALFEQTGKNTRYTKLQELAPYTIGVGRGYANTDEFDKATYLKKEE